MPMTIVPRYAWLDSPYPPVPMARYPIQYVFQSLPTREYTPKAPSPGARPTSPLAFREAAYLYKRAQLSNHDIEYNFLLGTDGYVYEGRGWEMTSLLPQKYATWSKYSMHIAFLGDYRVEPPPDEIYQLRDELLRFGVQHSYILPIFKIISLAENITKYHSTLSNLAH